MAKKTIDNTITELKDLAKKGKLVYGTKETLKSLEDKKLTKVIVSNNCPEETYAQIEKYSRMNNIALDKVSYNNDELGVICKKQFFISVLGIKQ